MTDRTHPDSGRIITSSDLLLQDAETALMYEELRAAIDDGHESMTHADALAEIAAIRAENIELRAKHASIRAGGVQPLRKCLHQIEEPLEKVLERREAVIKILERDAHEAHQRAAHALGTRKVLWNLLGECSPLLHQLECNDRESEEQLNSLLRRIDDARAVVQAEEMPGRSDART